MGYRAACNIHSSHPRGDSSPRLLTSKRRSCHLCGFWRAREIYTIPLDASAVASLVGLMRSLKTNLVFYNQLHKPLDPGRISKAMLRATREAGLIDFRPHDLRRTYATRKLQSGYTLDQVKDLLGHDSIETTEVYAYHDVESLRAPHNFSTVPVGNPEASVASA
jgi:integrase